MLIRGRLMTLFGKVFTWRQRLPTESQLAEFMNTQTSSKMERSRVPFSARIPLQRMYGSISGPAWLSTTSLPVHCRLDGVPFGKLEEFGDTDGQ